ncbi:MAG TPA: hypothetical protein VHO50_12105 [Bacteroidales bacterium]|nr:hypothetical protein [Bacteroidales bacterium]
MIIKQFIKGIKAYGLNILIKPDGQFIVDSILIRKNRKGLRIISKEAFSGFDSINKKISKSVPLYISLDGKGIIHKLSDDSCDEFTINSILPNAEENDFVIQEVHGHDKKLISVARKDKIIEILNIFKDQGFSVLKIFLGPFSIFDFPELTGANNDFSISNYRFNLIEGKVIGFERINFENEYNVVLDGTDVESKYIVPFSNAINHFGSGTSVVSNNNDLLKPADFNFNRLASIVGWFFLLFLFAGLLLNYLLFKNFNSNNQLLATQINKNKEVLIELEKTKLQLKSKEDFLSRNINNNSLYVYYLDRISKDIPLSITLNRFCISPPVKPQSGSEIKDFQRKIIVLSGNTTTSKSLDSWFKSIKKYTWIDEIAIKNYSDNNGLAKFDIEIKISE